MNLLVSILLVLSTWLIFQQWFIWQRKRRRTVTLTADQGIIRDVVDRLELIVTPDQKYLTFVANQPTHTVGRLVLTEQWLVLSCDQGLLLKVDRGQPLSVKELGSQRLILLGTAVNPLIHLRIIVTKNGDDEWVSSLHHFCS